MSEWNISYDTLSEGKNIVILVIKNHTKYNTIIPDTQKRKPESLHTPNDQHLPLPVPRAGSSQLPRKLDVYNIATTVYHVRPGGANMLCLALCYIVSTLKN